MKRSSFILPLLSLLGYSCENSLTGPNEYGSPYAEFEVKGRVTDSENNPIRDIRINVRFENRYANTFESSTNTDAEGRFTAVTDVMNASDGIGLIKAEDMDGTKNGGLFKADSVSVAISASDFEGGKGQWNDGKVSKNIDLVLEPENEE